MRILHVVPSYLPATRYGGPIYSVHGLCRALVEQGHDVEVCTTSVDGSGDSDVPHDRPVVLDGVRVRYFRSARLRRLYYAPDMKQYLRVAMRAFDVMHLHSVFLWPTSMAARIAVAARVPYLVAPRGMLVPELIREKSRLLKTSWLQLVDRRTLRAAAGLHVTSTLEQRAAARLSLPMPRSFVVPNGVDVPDRSQWAAPPAELTRWIGDGPYILYLGRLSWKKGLDRLLEAAAGCSARFVICGDDDEGCRDALVDRAAQLRIADRVLIGPSVHGGAKWRLLAGARCLVLASMQENFGNVVVEAMAVGCPVVVTPEVGAHEVVLQAECGIVCPGDPAALAAALRQLDEDNTLRAGMGQRGASYARDHLSWKLVAERMSAAYQAILA
jgi:glycosyltransferase involved in cell wall biosynthesis